MARTKALNLEGAVVAVTGGARGIGLAITEAMLAAGAKVSIGDIDVALAEKEAQRLGIFAARLDVRSRESFTAFLDATETALGPIDVLVNNAGIMPMGAFTNEDPALAEAQIDINFRGVFYGTQLALPGMLTRHRGHIVNIASLAGRFAIPGAAVYTGTKFAVVGMTEAVAAENRGSGVNFTIIMPSKVTTELASGTDDAGRGIPAVSPQEVAQAVVNAVRHPRLMVAVPDYLQTAHALYGLVPSWLQERGRRILGDNRILTNLDHKAHAGYEQRIAKLAVKK
ncbi:SDR family oxidoreductase [Aquirhabdus parva]|uniref:SDR family NAD(P)-dependent oxidoreductase n=1 Tax=Aquirhabdus parva TaxID=2283318 RepID=A0A345PA46_9GAMM|nr:SDR family oxidoreductase [Aquirhabdus parva]AXI04155.1 SDR family NAD(P)-dependent oxidoreductase [Aquirhabdus parva]